MNIPFANFHFALVRSPLFKFSQDVFPPNVLHQRSQQKRRQSRTHETFREDLNDSLTPHQSKLRIPRIFSKASVQTVHFIRHAQGFHNVAGEANPEEYRNPKFHDAHLTAEGWQQVRRLRAHFDEIEPLFRVDLVIVSPLTRTLETACGLFGNLSPTNDERPLMLGRDAIEGLRPAHGLITSNGSPPFLAIEACRERVDVHPCDKRRSRSYFQLNFPGVDFGQVEDDEDPFPANSAETPNAFLARTHEFLQIVNSRPERHIAVVSHGVYLSTLCRQFGQSFGRGVKSSLHKSFANCEMRSVVISDQFGDPNSPCEVSHPGGVIRVQSS